MECTPFVHDREGIGACDRHLNRYIIGSAPFLNFLDMIV